MMYQSYQDNQSTATLTVHFLTEGGHKKVKSLCRVTERGDTHLFSEAEVRAQIKEWQEESLLGELTVDQVKLTILQTQNIITVTA